MLVRWDFSAEEKQGKVKDEGRYSVAPAVPLWCGPRWWWAELEGAQGHGHLMGPLPGIIHGKGWSCCRCLWSSGKPLARLGSFGENREALPSAYVFFSHLPSISCYCPTCLSTLFINPCHFSSCSLKTITEEFDTLWFLIRVYISVCSFISVNWKWLNRECNLLECK